MSETTTAPQQTIEERLLALENQAYVTYLQVNALVKELATKEVIDTEALISTMDEINKTLFEATQSAIAETAPEVAVEAPVEA